MTRIRLARKIVDSIMCTNTCKLPHYIKFRQERFFERHNIITLKFVVQEI